MKKAISANALLSLLEPSEQQALAAVAHLQRFAKGQTIYEEGKPAADIWVVASGQVKIVKFSEGGQALALELMIAPELFGAVFYAQPRDTRRTCRGHRGNGDSNYLIVEPAGDH